MPPNEKSYAISAQITQGVVGHTGIRHNMPFRYTQHMPTQLPDLRKEKNLTQEELAAEIGCDTATIARYEQGKRRPTQRYMQILAEYFQVPAYRIWSETPYERPKKLPLIAALPGLSEERRQIVEQVAQALSGTEQFNQEEVAHIEMLRKLDAEKRKLIIQMALQMVQPAPLTRMTTKRGATQSSLKDRRQG